MNEPDVLDTLRAERAAVLVRISTMTADFDGIVADSLDSNADDEHDPEGSTIAYERAQVAALIAAAQSKLDDLDHALARLSAGHYSVCEGCGGPISLERLTALPASRTCFECALAGRSR
jgi:DnaK suppressor protein